MLLLEHPNKHSMYDVYIYIYIYNLKNCTFLTEKLNIRGKDMPLVSFIKDAVLPVVERYNMRYRNQ